MSRPLVACVLALSAFACHRSANGSLDGGSDGFDGPVVGGKCTSSVAGAGSRCAIAQTSTLPSPRTVTTALHMGNDVVLVGGQGPGGEVSNAIFVNSPSGGALGQWRNYSFSDAHPNAGIAASGDRLYIVGGEIPGTLDAVPDGVMSHRNPDGSFGEFQALPPLPAGRTQMGAAATATHLYLLGGRTQVAANDDATVLVGNLDQEGNVTGWSAGNPLPHGRGRPSVVVVKDRLYVVGGLFSGNDRSCAAETVLFAQINPDGSLGAWTGTTSLPRLPAGAAVAATDDHLFVVGGVANYGDSFQQLPVGSILSGKIEEDGAIDSWQRVAFFRDNRYGHSAIVDGSHLYVFGGLVDGVRVLDEILSVTVKGDGTVSCD